MDEIILIGGGGHARSCIDVIELTGLYKIAGLVEKDNVNEKENFRYPIMGTRFINGTDNFENLICD